MDFLSTSITTRANTRAFFQDDGLKFGLSGNYGFTRFATAVKYTFDKILVVPNSNALVHNPLVLKPKFGSQEFETLFHFRPQGAITFIEYVEKLKNANIA